jgi:zinc and cadmium transporter
MMPDFSTLTWIVLFSLVGGVLSVSGAALVALNTSKVRVPMLISYAIGAMLGAVFLEILPHAIEEASSPKAMTATVLFGILLFFALEKLVIWRHCHGDHCEVHAVHTEEECPDNQPVNTTDSKTKFKLVTQKKPAITAKHSHSHEHDFGRSGMMIMIGDTFHNFVDGILIASAFMLDVKIGIVTAVAIVAHEIPQEVGDFFILLHSGYSKKQAYVFNLISSLATMVGGLAAYYALQQMQGIVPFVLGIAAASLLYVSVADLIALGVSSIGLIGYFLH